MGVNIQFVDYRMDPGRRLYDQMVMAARCGVANIAEESIGNPPITDSKPA